MSDIRAALERLIELDDTVPHNRPGWIQEWANAIAAARAAPPAPLEGEVGDLVDSLECEARNEEIMGCCAVITAAELRRAAALLQQRAATAPAVVPVAIPGEQWHEDDGACLWWRFPIEEPPWAGDPREDDWPGYHTHFTQIVCPVLPAPQGGEVEG